MGARARRIGLLGGSFNPAHEGHVHISRAALRTLGLDEVWWLVSPQNPLKSPEDIAPLGVRLAVARDRARDRRIKVTDIERHLGTRFTVDLVMRLQHLNPRAHFIWLMGADGLVDFHHWRHWRRFARRIVIAVFARPHYGSRALCARAMAWLRHFRCSSHRAREWVKWRPPAIIFPPVRPNFLSATLLRERDDSWPGGDAGGADLVHRVRPWSAPVDRNRLRQKLQASGSVHQILSS